MWCGGALGERGERSEEGEHARERFLSPLLAEPGALRTQKAARCLEPSRVELKVKEL